jgi:hypothetical protein
VENKEMLKLFEDISIIFKAQYQESLWMKYKNRLDDPISAVSLFLEGYAFERQGRSPAFSPASIEAVNYSKNYKDSKDFADKVWENFCNSLGNERLNFKLNPIYHEVSSCECVWCKLGSENVVSKSKQELSENLTRSAWERLVKIRGIGPKIASLFLRDIAICYNLAPTQERWLLQPIDVWVRRTVLLMNHHEMNKNIKNVEIAKWIAGNSKKPELCNQGMWYFGAKIAQSEFKLSKYLENTQYAKKATGEHVAALKSNAKAILELDFNLQ